MKSLYDDTFTIYWGRHFELRVQSFEKRAERPKREEIFSSLSRLRHQEIKQVSHLTIGLIDKDNEHASFTFYSGVWNGNTDRQGLHAIIVKHTPVNAVYCRGRAVWKIPRLMPHLKRFPGEMC